MRIVVLAAGVALLAGVACAGWTRTVVLGTNATTSAALPAFQWVDGDVVGVVAVAGTVAVPSDVVGVAATVSVGGVPGGIADVTPAASGDGGLGVRDMPAITGLAGLDAGGLAGGVTVYGASGGANLLGVDVGGFARAFGTMEVRTNPVPLFATVAGVAPCEVDPFLSFLDVWDDGPLGELRHAANLLRGGGDGAAFGKAADEYWRAMNSATERREMFKGRGKRGRVVTQ